MCRVHCNSVFIILTVSALKPRKPTKEAGASTVLNLESYNRQYPTLSLYELHKMVFSQVP